MIRGMGSLGLSLVVLAGIGAALLTSLLVIVAAKRGRCDGRARVLAMLVGVVVLALVALNLFQYAARPAGDAEDAAGLRMRSTRLPMTAPSTTQPMAPTPALDLADHQIVQRYTSLFYDTDATWTNRTWLGVRALQNPNDAWVHQELIVEQKPDYIIEAGTAAGGSALLWALVLREVNPKGRVITIDIDDLCAGAREHPLWKQRIDFMLGSSTDPRIIDTIAQRVRGKKVLVILDSDHRKEHVLNELKAYSPMVSVGGYLIVQDTEINGHPVHPTFGPGPMEAVDEFLAGDDRFVSDRSREALLHTMHPKGYLKRVK
jgi:cephalosporin hydroxylase